MSVADSVNDIVRMANQIAEFFSAYPETDAVEGIRDHIVKSWPPTMRLELTTLANQSESASDRLHPLAIRAARLLLASEAG